MSDYVHPYRDTEFVLNELAGFASLCQHLGLEDGPELASAILAEAGKLGSEVLAPLNIPGDRQGAKLEEQGVQESTGFSQAYQQFRDSGWQGLTASETHGGQGLPNALGAAVNEVWHSANLSFALCPMLTQGAIEALAHHATPELQARYLPKLVSGEWTGTMNLTEPDAGSDLAAVKAKAIPAGDHYLISGQKIFITWGDHQMTDNIVHLVLARLPDAPFGVKGISLFLVPKFLLDDQGNPGQRNDVHCVSLEHKLGIHASPTCTMSFGDQGGAVGYLVGEAHNGLTCMFTMMNHARQGVGLQGLAISERSYQQALQYAKERLQGTNKDGSRYPIIRFPDVRRMLMQMKASIEAMRGLALVAAAELDWVHCASAENQSRHQARVDLLTPIVKGWLTELAQEVTYLGIQIHGGMGFVEETGSAQHYRDARILTIYEGTTGIQALDLVGRKTLLNDGTSLGLLLDEIDSTCQQLEAAGNPLATLGHQLRAALTSAREARLFLLDKAASDKSLAGSISVNFLMLCGYLCGGWIMGQSALKARDMLDSHQGDAGFLNAKQVTAAFYADHLLPRVQGLLGTIRAGSTSIMALPEELF